MAFDLSKFIGRFVEESGEHLTALNKGMQALENNAADEETINQIFRSAHTIKGSSRMLKLIPISELAHTIEDALGALREGKIQFTPGLATILYKGIDAIAALIEKTGKGESIDGDQSDLLQLLAGAVESKVAGKPEEPAVSPAESSPAASEDEDGSVEEANHDRGGAMAVPPISSSLAKEPGKKGKSQESIRINTDKLSELIRLASEITSRHSRTKQNYQEIHNLSKQVELFSEKARAGSNEADVLQQVAIKLNATGNSLKDDYILQDLLVRDLQERSLKLRMLPLTRIFDTFHRSVREIAAASGKEICLEIIGDEIEMDKKIIEKLGDPLVHMFRNAIDHGIESPQERKKAGKPAKGTIKLNASYEGGKVLIVMEDDGKGLALEKIKEKALSKGLATPEKLAGMSVSEIQNIIFSPGFSTSAIITDISGRGVGMDVVKNNIVGDLKGSINIESEVGKGTIFKIRLPMTLAIMHVVIIEVGKTKFALPVNYISEIIKVNRANIIDVYDKRAVNIRDQLVPVENLQTILNLPTKVNRADNAELLLVVIKIGAERLGLIVNAVLDEDDMVIKSLPVHMKSNKMVSGVIITGRDQVVNVLNVPSLFIAAKETKGVLTRKADADNGREINILVVDDSINTREIEKSILEAYGYNVTLAEDGIEALEKAKKVSYDIVITDVEMPRMDGFTLTEKLRADENYKNTPIMLLTSRDKDADKRRGIQVGANAYILKGDFEQSNLISTIENLL